MKIIYTDRKEEKKESKPAEEVIDKTKEQETIESKESKSGNTNVIIWGLLILALLVLIYGLWNAYNKKEDESTK